MTGPENQPRPAWNPKTPEEVKKELAAMKSTSLPSERSSREFEETKHVPERKSALWAALIEAPVEVRSEKFINEAKKRRTAVTALLSGRAKGEIGKLYEEVQKSGADRYLDAIQAEDGRNEFEKKLLADFFRNHVNGKRYDDLVQQIGVRSGKISWLETLREQALAESGGGSDRGEWLRAIEMQSKIFNEAVRRERLLGVPDGQVADWSALNEDGRKLVRLSEIVHVTARLIRMDKGWMTEEEKSQDSLYLRMRRNLTGSDDVPEGWKEIMNNPSQFPEKEDKTTKKKSSVKKTTEKSETTGKAELKESEPKDKPAATPLPEKPVATEAGVGHKVKVFDREVEVSPENLKEMSREISNLLASDKLGDTYLAAQKLAHLKRMGVGIGGNQLEDGKIVRGKKWEKVSNILNERREAIRQRAMDAARKQGKPGADAEVVAKYLMYLKSLGMLDNVQPEETAMIRSGMEAGSRALLPDLLKTATNAKYVGAIDTAYAQKFLPQFEKEMRQAKDAGDGKAFAYCLARLNHLGISSPGLLQIIEEANSTEEAEGGVENQTNLISTQLSRFIMEENWEKLAETYLAATYTKTPKPALEHLSSYLVDHVENLRKSGMWSRFVTYLGALGRISRRQNKVITELNQPIDVADAGAGGNKTGEPSQDILKETAPKPEPKEPANPTEPPKPTEEEKPGEAAEEESEEALAKSYWERYEREIARLPFHAQSLDKLRQDLDDVIAEAGEEGILKMPLEFFGDQEDKLEFSEVGKELWAAMKQRADTLGYRLEMGEIDKDDGQVIIKVTKKL